MLPSGKARDNKTDANVAEHDARGRFTCNGSAGTQADNKNLLKGRNDVKIDKEIEAPFERKIYYRSVLVGCSTQKLGVIHNVSDHACNRMYERGINPQDVKDALKSGVMKTDNEGYIYSLDGVNVCVSADCNIKKVYTQKTKALTYGFDKFLKQWNERRKSK